MIEMPHLLIPRRRFLQTLAGSAAALSLGDRGFAADEKSVTVAILHTTDLHGHIMPTKTYEGVENVGGLARCVTQIRRWQKENPNYVLLDIGDVYQGTHVSRATGGVARGNNLLFALPGSTKAVELAVSKLILPEIRHLLAELRK